jgi:hypothetical protein
VLELSQHLHLAPEGGDLFGQGDMYRFQRGWSAGEAMSAAIDDAHTSAADASFDLVGS